MGTLLDGADMSHIKICKDRGSKVAVGQGFSQDATSLWGFLFVFPPLDVKH